SQADLGTGFERSLHEMIGDELLGDVAGHGTVLLGGRAAGEARRRACSHRRPARPRRPWPCRPLLGMRVAHLRDPCTLTACRTVGLPMRCRLRRGRPPYSATNPPEPTRAEHTLCPSPFPGGL